MTTTRQGGGMDAVQALIEELRQAAVRLWLEEGELRFRASKGAMTPERMARVRALKPELVAFLQSAQQAGGARMPPLAAAQPRPARLPLSFMQERLWLLERLEHLGTAYHITAGLRLAGALDASALERALAEIVRRHEVLRTRFAAVEGGEGAEQVIDAPGSFALERADLSAEPEDAREHAMREAARAFVQRPFDLARGPLFRALLLRLSAGEHVVVVAMHHSVADGWSVGVLVPELGALYAAFAQGRPSPLPALPLQYADYALWQRGWLQGDALRGELDHWTRHLAGAPAALELPTDHPRPPAQSFRGATHTFALPRALVDRLQALAQAEGATLFMALLAAFNAVLARWSGQRDLVVGTPVAGRTHRATEGLIGFFVNTLALRTDVSGDPSFRALLARVKDTALEGFAHQHLPFERLVEALRPARDRARTPVFQVLFALQNYAEEALVLPGLRITRLERAALDAGSAKLDLSLFVMDDGARGLVGVLEYATDLFTAQTMARFAGHYRRLLEAAVAAPDTPLSGIDLLGEDERHRLLVEWNATQLPYERDVPAVRLFERQVERTPEAVAAICEQDELSYRELDARANRLAHALRARGVGPEALVGLCLPRGLDTLVAVLGIQKAGGAYVPLDPAYPAERIQVLLQEARPALVVTQSDLRPLLPGAALLCLDEAAAELQAQPAHRVEVRVHPDNLCHVIYTSGSTGRPKVVGIRHGSVSALLAWTRHVFPAEELRHVLAGTSLNFDISVFEMFAPLTCGGTVWMVPNVLALVQGSRAARAPLTLLNTVPSAAAQLQRSGAIPASVVTVNLAGEAFAASLVRDLYGTTNARRVINLYGPSEDTTYSTWSVMPRDPQGPIPVGRPVSNSQAYVLDDALQLVPPGAVGEVYLAGDGLSRGYLHRPDLTAERYLPDPIGPAGTRMYRTGDLGRWRADGELEYMGRIDHQVKIRGFRIELGEIEAALDAQPGVREALVLAREDSPGDKRLVAYVVARPGHALTPGELRAALARRLPDYMVPAHVILLDAFPALPNGKVNRAALPAPDLDAAADTRAATPPQGEMETRIAAAWRALLGVEQVGREDNFFALGGHSLLVVRLADALRQDGIALDMQGIFGAPTLAGMAARAEAAAQAAQPAVPVPPSRIPPGATAITPDMLPLVTLTQAEIDAIVASVPGGAANVQDIYPLGPLQEGMLFQHLMQPQGDDYILRVVLGFPTESERARFLDALRQVIARHDVLRSAMRWQGLPRPVQVVQREAALSVQALPPGHGLHGLLEETDPRQLRMDLSRAPLIGAVTARALPGEAGKTPWLVALLNHHIVLDHLSVDLLVREVELLLAGRADRLAAPLPYRDFVFRALAVQPAGHEAYFRAELGDVEQPTAAFGLLRVREDDAALHQQETRLPPALAARLRDAARRHGASPAVLFHLAWAQVLARCSGQRDVVFGTVLLGRAGAAAEAMGIFINTLPLRVRLAGRGVEPALKEVQAGLAALLRHEQASLTLAQRASGVDGSLPLFTTLLNFRHSAERGGQPEATGGVQPRVLHAEERTHYPLALVVDDFGTDFGVIAQVAGSVIDPGRVCGYVLAALDQIATLLDTDPRAPMHAVDVLPAEERQRVLVEWNATESLHDAPVTAMRLIERQAARTPDAVALAAGDQELRYAELNARANQLARALRARGVGPEVVVGLCMERGLDVVVALLAILKAGGVHLPMDPDYPAERLRFMQEDARPALVLTQSALRERAAGADVLCVDAIEGELAAYPTEDFPSGVHPDNLAYIIYTSGSTGRPKGVAVRHASMAAFGAWIAHSFSAGELRHMLIGTSLSFDFSVFELLGPLVTGGTAWIVPNVLALAQGGTPPPLTLLNTVTPAAAQLVRANAIPRSVRTFVAGGETLSPQLVEQLYAAAPLESVVNVYGPTEDTVFSTTARIAQGAQVVPIGRPLADKQAYVLDDMLEPVPQGVAGELYLAGIGLARGYLGRPALTAERFVPNPFGAPGSRMYRSGDLARHLPDGSLDYAGRIDHQVKIRGFRIELGEIEAVLAAQPGVHEAAVLAREDQPGDKRLVAYAAAREGHQLSVPALRAALAERLPEHMVPAHFVLLPQFPLSTTGKTDRKALPPPEAAGEQAGYEAPVGPVEEAIAAAWAELLGLERVGRQDNFFELGGHSLLAVSLIAQLRRQGIQTNVRSVFAAATLAELAAGVAPKEGASDGATGTSAPQAAQVPPNRIPPEAAAITPDMLPLVELTQAEIDAVVATVHGGVANVQDIYPLAPLQEGFLFHHLLSAQQDIYLHQVLLAFPARAELDRFVAAFGEVVQRHDVLRTGFVWEQLRAPVQVVWRHAPLPLEELRLAGDDVEAQLRARVPRMDLREAPLVRCNAVHDAAKDRWLLQVLVHHLVDDGVSVQVLVGQIEAILAGRGDALPPAVPFREYVAHARRVPQAEHEAFFQSMLAGVEEPSVPYGLLDTRGDGALAEARLALDAALAARVRRHARLHNVSAASLMHLAWALVIARACGRRGDVVFGTVLFGRMQGGAGAEHAIGPFINTLPIRIRLGALGVRESLLQAHRTLTELLVHEHASLAVAQRASALPANAPLFTALMNYRHGVKKDARASAQPEEPVLQVEVLGSDERSNYPVALMVDDDGEGFVLSPQVSAGAIPPERLCAAMQRAVEQLVDLLDAEPEAPVTRVDVLPPEERRQLLETWNATAAPYPRELTAAQMVERQAARTPDALALVCGPQRLSYRDLNTCANRLAHALRARGVGPEVLVGLFLPRSADLLVALLAVMKAGGAYVPLDPAYPEARTQGMLEDARPKLVVTLRSLAARLPSAEVLCVDAPEANLGAFPDTDPLPGIAPENLAYVIYTSGSTGRPKGVAVRHGGMSAFVAWIVQDFSAEELRHVLAGMSLNFDYSLFELFGPLACGGTVWLAANVLSLAEEPALREAPLTLIATVPSAAAQLERAGVIPPSVRVLALGGEATTAQLAAQLYRTTNARVCNLYGPSEDTVVSTWTPVERGTAGPVPIGRPMANARAYVLDDALEPVPQGVAGELYVAGAGLARGYLNQPALTAERFLPDPFGAPGARMYRTGDLARHLSDGRIDYLGRVDQQVKIRGFRIELGEIEAVLGALPGVHEAVVLAREDRPGDKRLVAYVVRVAQAQGEEGTESERADDAFAASLRAGLARRLPEHMVPPHVVVLPSFPLSPGGKIDRKALPAPELRQDAARHVPPLTPTEAALAAIWAEVLRVERVGVHDDFFALGGHSLLAMQAVSRIRARIAPALSLSALLAHPSIAQLADHLAAQLDGPEQGALLVPMEDGHRGGADADANDAREPLYLIHGAGGEILNFGPLARALAPHFRVTGVRSPESVGGASPATLEALAALYAQRIAERERGPLHLAGWSMGGLLAMQVARRLQARGIAVRSIGLVDSYIPDASATEAEAMRQADALLARSLAADPGAAAALLQGEPDTLRAQQRTLRHHAALALQFAPAMVDAPLHLFWAGDNRAAGARSDWLAWTLQPQASSATVLAADHLGILGAEPAARIAAVLASHVAAGATQDKGEAT